MKKSLTWIIRVLGAAIISLFFTFLAYSGALYVSDAYVSDSLYQSVSITDGEIVVVGIDEKAIDELGALPWDRAIMADVIMYLNSTEDDPAVIGIDVLYSSDSPSEDSDKYLADAASNGNVVVACAATFNSTLVAAGNSFYMDNMSVTAFERPYEELSDSAEYGHINILPDADGVIRHATKTVKDLESNEIKSFSRRIYEKYCQSKNIEEKPEPGSDSNYWYIPYTTRAGGYYDYISASDLYYERIDPEFFSGKVVLIGAYTAGLQDSYYTSIDRSEPTYGVEIQANIIDAYRKGVYPRDISNNIQFILLFTICFLMALFFYDRKVSSDIVAEILVCGGYVAGAYFLYHKAGIVLHVLWIPLFVTALFLGSVIANYVHSYREKKQIENTFGHYVDHAVMKELLEKGKDGLELGGKRRDVAVLFVDVRGFTTMSEGMEPETVVEIINKYLTLTTECIMKNHGTLDKFVGDCTMAFWNAPVSQEDPVYLACRAAFDMVTGSKKLGEELVAKYGRSVSFGIGINYGPAVVGNIGAPERMDYTALGDTVNTAARLEANAPGETILISRAVADALGSRAKITSLGNSIKLKGKKEDFEVIRLDALD